MGVRYGVLLGAPRPYSPPTVYLALCLLPDTVHKQFTNSFCRVAGHVPKDCRDEVWNTLLRIHGAHGVMSSGIMYRPENRYYGCRGPGCNRIVNRSIHS